MVLTNDSGITQQEVVYYYVSVFMMLMYWLSFPLGLAVDPACFAMLIAFVIYVCYSSATDTSKYIKNVVPLQTLV